MTPAPAIQVWGGEVHIVFSWEINSKLATDLTMQDISTRLFEMDSDWSQLSNMANTSSADFQHSFDLCTLQYPLTRFAPALPVGSAPSDGDLFFAYITDFIKEVNTLCKQNSQDAEEPSLWVLRTNVYMDLNSITRIMTVFLDTNCDATATVIKLKYEPKIFIK